MGLFGSNRIYLDYASATPLREEAARAMREAEALSGNPGSIHSEGVAAMRSLTYSRERIAKELACKAREIVFTSGLSESNNLAILGFAQALDREGKNIVGTHWITSSIEHPSVLECFSELERLGAKVSHVDPEPSGVVRAEKVVRALRKESIFVSIGWANSEIGTVQPLADIARVIHAHEKEHRTGVLLHADAGQAPLYLAPRVHTLGVDLLTLGSGKLYGPRGVGALYRGKRTALSPLTLGGAQERGVRAGTESVALAAGFSEALASAAAKRAPEAQRLQKSRDDFARDIIAQVPGVIINGDLRRALPHMLNISIPNINSEYLVLALDRAGLAISTKAACSEGDRSESHVVAALGGEKWRSTNTLRISFGNDTTARSARRAHALLIRVLATLPRDS